MKKVISIIILSLVGLLITATVVLAIVPITTYNPVSSDVNYVVVYKNSATNYNMYLKDSEQAKKLVELNEKSHKQNILSTMFQGALGNKAQLEKVTQANISSVLNSSNAGYFVEFNYDNAERTLQWEGKDYVYKDGTADKLAMYDKLVVAINDTSSFAKITVYVVNEGKYMFKITTHAHQNELFDYISQISFPSESAK